MLRLTGRSGDGWLPSLGYAEPDQIPEMQRQIDVRPKRGTRSPRNPPHIQRHGRDTDGPVQAPLQGPPEHWVETLVHLGRDFGFDDFIFGPGGMEPLAQVERFAQEVAPAVRENLR